MKNKQIMHFLDLRSHAKQLNNTGDYHWAKIARRISDEFYERLTIEERREVEGFDSWVHRGECNPYEFKTDYARFEKYQSAEMLEA